MSTKAADDSGRFSDEERAAMKERAAELKAEARRGKREDQERAVLATIAEMPEPDRTMARRIHELVATHAPALSPKTWYGMPAYARNGTVVCFFQSASKFKERYATLGFSGDARLDDGPMWPTAFALAEWTPDVEARVAELISRAAGER